MKIDIVGRGKVGSHLYARFAERGADVALVDSRNPQGIRHDSDLILIAVSDTAIAEVAAKVVGMLKGFVSSPVVAHVSGSTSIEAIPDYPRRGVFYPFQSFSEQAEIDFSRVPLLIEPEGEEADEVLKRAAGILGVRVVEADGDQRKGLHLAGVFCCNFLNEMLAIGYDILHKTVLEEDIVFPLVELTVAKAIESGPANVRTGPAARGDRTTIDLQLESLAESPSLQDIYRAITKHILNKTGNNLDNDTV